jgi:two-component system sensor histidine kinase PilS (NtrC family)
MLAKFFRPRETDTPLAFWRSLYYYNVYRLIVAVVFAESAALFGAETTFGALHPPLFLVTSTVYVLLCLVSVVTISFRWPLFNYQLGFQIVGDVLAISLLMFASGGVKSGMGLLLLVSLAAAGLVTRGRMAVFYAAVASLGVLIQQAYLAAFWEISPSEFVHAGMLSMGYFAMAWLARTLAQYSIASERLAEQRGIDLENLAQVNQLVIQDMQDGVLVVDETDRVWQANAQAQRLLGTTFFDRRDLTVQDYSSALAERLRRWRENPDVVFDPMRVPATGRQVRVRFVPLHREQGTGALIFVEDLSRVQEQAQQLKLAALGRLTANIAHEIRNPLSAVSHANQLLQEEIGFDPTHKRLLQIIQDNTFRLDRMVQDVLQLNRRDRAQIEQINTDAFLRGFVDEFCQVEKIPRECFSVEIGARQPICFDRAHLNQILWNLCRNAWRHSRKQAASVRLVVSEAHLNNVIQIDVIDDGEGVSPLLQSQLFEPFFTTESKGTGLGLYIAREICAANGATLDYVEVAPGGQFRICCKGGPC